MPWTAKLPQCRTSTLQLGLWTQKMVKNGVGVVMLPSTVSFIRLPELRVMSRPDDRTHKATQSTSKKVSEQFPMSTRDQ